MATILHDSIGIVVAVVVVTQVYAPMSITASHYNHEKMEFHRFPTYIGMGLRYKRSLGRSQSDV